RRGPVPRDLRRRRAPGRRRAPHREGRARRPRPRRRLCSRRHPGRPLAPRPRARRDRAASHRRRRRHAPHEDLSERAAQRGTRTAPLIGGSVMLSSPPAPTVKLLPPSFSASTSTVPGLADTFIGAPWYAGELAWSGFVLNTSSA